MTTQNTQAAGAPRAVRADAQANRERILAAAAAEFMREGADASLRGIARAAGVGVGTLFRHFGSREELIEALFRHELTRLCDAAEELAAAGPPEEALREWSRRFMEYMRTKACMGDTLRAIFSTDAQLYATTRRRLEEAVAVLLTAGVRDGVLRADVDPDDALGILGGVTYMAGELHQREQAERMIELLIRATLVTPPA
jgi:AcrR family transcriptional regulator